MNGNALVTAIWAANFAGTAYLLRSQAGAPGALWCRSQVLIATTCLPFTLVGHYWTAAGFCAATLILLLGNWWKRKGRKVARQLGEKSRAVLAAIVERAREAGTPVPQGVRA